MPTLSADGASGPRRFCKTALFNVMFAFGLEVASAKLIHDWTVSSSWGEFGYVELGGDGFPTEGDFLFGRFDYIQTGIGSSAVIAAGTIFRLRFKARRLSGLLRLLPLLPRTLVPASAASGGV